MINPGVYSCIGLVMSATQQVKLVLMDGEAKVTKENVSTRTQPAFDLLNQPNKYQAMPEFLSRWALYMNIGGSAFMEARGVEPREDIFGEMGFSKAMQLRLIRPDWVRTFVDDFGDLSHFERFINSTWLRKPPEALGFTLFSNPLHEFEGFSPIQAGATTINAHTASIEWQKNTLENGGVPLMLVTIAGMMELGPKRTKQLMDTYHEQYAGAKNAGKPMIIPGDSMDAKLLSQTARELDWVGSKGTLLRDICALFGVPSVLLGDPESKTYANYEQGRAALYLDKVIPDLIMLVQELNRWLLPVFNDSSLRISIDESSVDALNEDENGKVERLGKAWWIEPNKKRELMGLPPKDGGDEPLVAFNLTPMSDIGVTDESTSNEDRSTKGYKTHQNEPLPHVDPRSRFATETDRQHAFDRVEALRAKFDRLIAEAMRKFFRQQRLVVDSRINPLIEPRAIPQELPPDFFGFVASEEQNELLFAALSEIEAGIVVTFGEDAIRQLQAEGVLFNIERPAVQQFLNADLALRARDMNLNTANRLNDILSRGIQRGESVNDIANNINDIYGRMTRSRSVAIARTEVARASNFASLEGFAQAGVTLKEWLSARDANVRDAHEDLDGDVVDIDEAFVSSAGGFGPAPGSMGNAADDVNCRCVLVPLRHREDAI